MSDAVTQADIRPGRFAIAIIAVALVQTAILCWMIYDRITLIESGREVVLDTVPIDPRSLFRGDYVILNYEISSLDAGQVEAAESFERGDPAYVTLAETDSHGWHATAVSRVFPDGAGPDEAVIRGRVSYNGGSVIRFKYGIESYFVPEGEGKTLEELVRERKLQVLVAVADDGEAAIKGLLVDGKLQYEEPLF